MVAFESTLLSGPSVVVIHAFSSPSILLPDQQPHPVMLEAFSHLAAAGLSWVIGDSTTTHLQFPSPEEVLLVSQLDKDQVTVGMLTSWREEWRDDKGEPVQNTDWAFQFLLRAVQRRDMSAVTPVSSIIRWARRESVHQRFYRIQVLQEDVQLPAPTPQPSAANHLLQQDMMVPAQPAAQQSPSAPQPPDSSVEDVADSDEEEADTASEQVWCTEGWGNLAMAPEPEPNN
jgi:hypothetical protein